jgi:hypothetical protein
MRCFARGRNDVAEPERSPIREVSVLSFSSCIRRTDKNSSPLLAAAFNLVREFMIGVQMRMDHRHKHNG